jgi:hypothetical protein
MMSSMFIAITSVDAGVSACATGIIAAAASASALTTAFISPSLIGADRSVAPAGVRSQLARDLTARRASPDAGGGRIVEAARRNQEVIAQSAGCLDQVRPADSTCEPDHRSDQSRALKKPEEFR